MENKFDCKEGGKWFQSKLKLNFHTRNSHKKKNCELCDVVVCEGNYSRHKKEKHLVLDENLNPLFKCEKCGKAFTGKTLRQVNDQVVEASHQKVKMFFEARPNYNQQNKETLYSGV